MAATVWLPGQPTRQSLLILLLLNLSIRGSLVFAYLRPLPFRLAARSPLVRTGTNHKSPDRSQEELEKGADVLAALDRSKGLLVLFTVPLAWGTFEPAVRYIYAMDPPLPALMFSVSYYLVAATTLVAAALAFDRNGLRKWPLLGGFELGTYLFVGNALQVFGLKTTHSDRAAFLLQLTTVFVPLVESVFARKAVSLRAWLACAVALVGVAVMGLDGHDGNTTDGVFSMASLTKSFNEWSQGDTLIVAAAMAYTFHIIRLEGYAQTTSAVKLAASKASVETLWSALSILGLFAYAQRLDSDRDSIFASFAVDSTTEIQAFGEAIQSNLLSGAVSLPDFLPAILAILWTGWVTIAYTIYAQSYGQRVVSPVTANLIYTIQPICTAIVAWLVLDERLGPAGYLGGALIGSAIILVGTKEGNGEQEKHTKLRG